MNAYEKAQALGLTGTDQQIVDVLKTLTTNDIPVSKVGPWLREKGLWYRGADGAMKGALSTIYAAADQATKDKLDILHSAVFGLGAQNILTTQPEWAGLAWQVISAIVAMDNSKLGLIDEFYALDGGRPFKDLTVQQYATIKTDAAALEVKQTALDAAIARCDAAAEAARTEFRKSDSTAQSIAAAAVSAFGA